MAVLEIPFDTNIPHYTQQTELDGKTYNLEFEFIERENFWMLHISDQDGIPLVCGIKLVADWQLLRRDLGVMGGELLLLNTERTNFLTN
ncbi:MAG: hypothetical protein WCK49_10180 [Myxococcaceae bacterium]